MVEIEEQYRLFRGSLEQSRPGQWGVPQVEGDPRLKSEAAAQLACRIGRLAEIDQVQCQPRAGQDHLLGLAVTGMEYGAESFVTANELVQGILQGFRINYTVQAPS